MSVLGRRWAIRAALALIAGACPGRVAARQAPSLLERIARLEVDSVSMADALRALQRSSGVAVAFSPDVLPPRKVTCACFDVSVRVALDRLLSGTDLVYVADRRQILVGTRGLDGTGSEPTRTTLVGVVVETSDGRPVAGADVHLVGTPRSALTTGDGRFALTGVEPGEHTLQVSALGYNDRSVAVGSDGPSVAGIRIELEPRPIPLEQLVIAPGSFGVLEVSPAAIGTTVSRDEIQAIPQFGDDVFRTLKRMPGVVAEDISTKLNVRGSTSRDLLVQLDGVELYEPYHLKDLDGALGIIDVQALGGVDLITGGFPADYGDKVGGVFNMHTRQPPLEGTRTTLGLSLSSMSLISQGRFAEDRGQWLLSLRRGFLQYVFAVTGVDDDLAPTYWDALIKARYLLSDDHLVSVGALHAGDDMRWGDTDTGSEINSSWGNSYAWVTHQGHLADGVDVETVVSAGTLTASRLGTLDDPGGGAFTPITADVSDVSDFDFAGVKQDWKLGLGGDLLLKGGVEVRGGRTRYDYTGTSSTYDLTIDSLLYVRYDTTSVAVDPSGSELGTYAALRGRAPGGVTWEAGVRYDRHSYTGDDDVAPRLLGRWDIGPRSVLRASWGRYFQSQGLHELSTRDGESAFYGSEMAEQVAAGVEQRFGAGLSVRLEAYHRRVDDPQPEWVNLARQVDPIEEVESDRVRIDADEGRADGIEAVVARDTEQPLSWSVSYALARSEALVNGIWAPRTLDQRHTLNLRGALRMGDSWQLSGSWQYHSGWPFTEQFLDVVATTTASGGQAVNVVRRDFGPLNAQRLPAYHRLDLRLTKRFRFERSTLELYMDVFNAYDRTNLRGYQWRLRGGPVSYSAQRVGGEEQLPLLPTLGLRWGAF